MENIKIIIYSLIQGITEFLPISSSAHLYLIQAFFNWEESFILLALGAHMGTLLAVLFHQRRVFYLRNINQNTSKLFIGALVASIPVILFGFLLTFLIKGDFNNNLLVIALASILGGILLDFSDNFQINKKESETLNFKQSLYIGFFQVLALIPGMSRSGCVITAMRFLGKDRIFCIKFSLLTSIPVLFLACSYSLYEVFYNYNIYILKFFTIILTSFLIALISIKFFINWTKNYSFRIFSIYRILLGLIIIIYLAVN